MRAAIFAALLFMGCGPTISFHTKCEMKDPAKFEKIFAICMAGQRKTTGTDDADDFVRACTATAASVSESCKKEMIAISGTEGHRIEWCSEAVYPEHIEACADAGFKK